MCTPKHVYTHTCADAYTTLATFLQYWAILQITKFHIIIVKVDSHEKICPCMQGIELWPDQMISTTTS